jgi:hypothetical protein
MTLPPPRPASGVGRVRARAAAIVAGLGAVAGLAPAVLAETPPGTYGGVEPVATDPGLGGILPIVIAAAVAVGAVLAVVVLARSRSRVARAVAATLVGVATVVGALFVLMLGVLSSWTDAGTNVPLPFVIGAAAVGMAGGALVLRLLLGLRRRRSDAAPSEVTVPVADAGPLP